ncbi:MAG: ATP synthase F1 subunit epsilon [Planctomycetes bacterium]|nr:ATP synthase F1 subunit epsilon [Planctomycetota bacterium]
MAETAFDFEVITPEGSSYRGRVTSLKLPGKKGSFGVLARHAPLVAALDAGLLRLRGEDGKARAFAVGEGFVEVRRAGVRVLVDFCNARGQIDAARAEKAAARAKERMRQRDGKVDSARAEAALRRSLARLSAVRLTGLD